MEGPEITFAETVIDNGKFGTRTIRFETGRLAQQAQGSAVAYIDEETMLLSATSVSLWGSVMEVGISLCREFATSRENPRSSRSSIEAPGATPGATTEDRRMVSPGWQSVCVVRAERPRALGSGGRRGQRRRPSRSMSDR